jgi:hypothetical protein
MMSESGSSFRARLFCSNETDETPYLDAIESFAQDAKVSVAPQPARHNAATALFRFTHPAKRRELRERGSALWSESI